MPEGTVISSAPASGTLLAGQAVALTMASCKPFVAVPDVTDADGASYAAAQTALAAVGIPASEVYTFGDTVAEGQLTSSAPVSDASVRSGAPDIATLSQGPDVVTLPPVYGLSIPSPPSPESTTGRWSRS